MRGYYECARCIPEGPGGHFATLGGLERHSKFCHGAPAAFKERERENAKGRRMSREERFSFDE